MSYSNIGNFALYAPWQEAWPLQEVKGHGGVMQRYFTSLRLAAFARRCEEREVMKILANR
jgi:hypothetical protein